MAKLLLSEFLVATLTIIYLINYADFNEFLQVLFEHDIRYYRITIFINRYFSNHP